MANNVTPTSTITASQIVVISQAPKIYTRIFTFNANQMFCHMILLVALPILIAVVIFDSWSVCITTLAVSKSASLPNPPIAISTSAIVITGALLVHK